MTVNIKRSSRTTTVGTKTSNVNLAKNGTGGN